VGFPPHYKCGAIVHYATPAMVTPVRFELTISCLKGRGIRPLSYGAKLYSQRIFSTQ
jgi:hypothetical protein